MWRARTTRWRKLPDPDSFLQPWDEYGIVEEIADCVPCKVLCVRGFSFDRKKFWILRKNRDQLRVRHPKPLPPQTWRQTLQLRRWIVYTDWLWLEASPTKLNGKRQDSSASMPFSVLIQRRIIIILRMPCALISSLQSTPASGKGRRRWLHYGFRSIPYICYSCPFLTVKSIICHSSHNEVLTY